MSPEQGYADDHPWGDSAQAEELSGGEPKVPLSRDVIDFEEWNKNFRDRIN